MHLQETLLLIGRLVILCIKQAYTASLPVRLWLETVNRDYQHLLQRLQRRGISRSGKQSNKWRLLSVPVETCVSRRAPQKLLPTFPWPQTLRMEFSRSLLRKGVRSLFAMEWNLPPTPHQSMQASMSLIWSESYITWETYHDQCLSFRKFILLTVIFPISSNR